MTSSSIVEDVEKWEPSHDADGNVKWYIAHSEYRQFSKKFCTHLYITQEFHHWASAQEKENICPHKDLSVNVHNVIIPESQNLETIQCPSTDEWVTDMQ